MAFQQQQPPPPGATATMYPPSYAAHVGQGSYGPVIAALAVIAVLGIIACVAGRLCSGGRIAGLRGYDFEGWIERKCGSSIGVRVSLPPPPSAEGRSGGGAGSSSAAEAPPEARHSPENQAETAPS
ncbi:hypothetical protein AXF42_Ash008278 [Apostasia shenzhenica]|uniref:Uncharacterized protein n=1 Tax=Apostasia shenzhenica TaxID=1088818 RepID=A0A2I0AXF7_9ASPA|nr:hypothetical protein AXF42_Ash008278 [Apostasia shenzhenica]